MAQRKSQYEPQSEGKACEVPNCLEAGIYRAPKSPQNLREYHWFCLQHVQAYNKGWNFCAHMTPGELEVFMAESLIGGQPTRPFGLRGNATRNPRWQWQAVNQAMRENMGYAFKDQPGAYVEMPEQITTKLTKEQSQAFSLFNLTPAANFTAVRTRYRLLAKKHHPDHNSGSRQAEQKLKQINLAYAVLKTFYNFR